MKRVVFIMTLFLGILAGCQQEVFDDSDRQIAVSFSPQSLSSSLKSSAASPAENLVTNLILYGVDDQGNVIQNFPALANPTLTGVSLTISKKVKSLYAIANPSSDLIAANPSNVSDLTDMTGNYTLMPQSPYLMGGKGDVNGYSVQIELIRTVAKIEILSKNEFIINTVTVKQSPDAGYVFQTETLSVPASAGLTAYPAVHSASPVLYVPENSKNNPTEFVVTGTYLGKQAVYTIVLTSGNVPIDIERNTNYQVFVSAITDTDCSIAVTIPAWNDYTSTISQVVTVPRPPDPYKNGIKILAIGNSYSEGTMQYMHVLFQKLGVTGTIKIVNAYISGGSLSQHATNARNGTNTGLRRQLFNASGTGPSTTTPSSLLQLIKEEPWDVITLQQASDESATASTYNADLDYLISYVNSNMTHNPNFKFGWHMTWAWAKTGRDGKWGSNPYNNQLNMYNGICNAVQTKIVPKLNAGDFDFIIPSGTAIQNARATALFGDNLNISDNTHLNALGSHVAAAMWIKTIAGYDFSNLPLPYNTGESIDQTKRTKIAQAVNAAFASPGY